MPYCYKCGQPIDDDALFCSRCGASVRMVEPGELLVERIAIPFPEGDDARLEIEIGAAGRVNVTSGGEGFVEGTIEYDVPEWVPRVERRGSTVRIVQAERFRARIMDNPVNRWELRLGDEKPFSLGVRSGVSSGRWELGGLPITGLSLNTGVSENTVAFSAPNPEAMDRFKVAAGVGEVRLSGLLDANFRSMDVKGGVGEIDMRFTGEGLRQDADVWIGGGVGSLKITVDESVPTRMSIQGLISVSPRGGFGRRRAGFPAGGDYANMAYDDVAGPRLEFNVSMGVGSVRLDTC